MSHRVTGAAAQVNVGGRIHTVLRGDIVPEGVDPAVLDGLIVKGLIESFSEAPEEPPAPAATGAGAPAAELPSKSWNHDRIDAWAGELDPPVLFDPAADPKLTKEQKLAQLAPQIEAARAAATQQ